MAVRVDAPGASRSFNSAAAGFGARRAGEDTRPRAHALTVAQRGPGAETVPAVRLQAPARPASHCPLRAHRARYSCQRCVCHFLVGCEALRPFQRIAHAQREQGHGAHRDQRGAVSPRPINTNRIKDHLWCRCLVDTYVLWRRCFLRVSRSCLSEITAFTVSQQQQTGLVLQSAREKHQSGNSTFILRWTCWEPGGRR